MSFVLYVDSLFVTWQISDEFLSFLPVECPELATAVGVFRDTWHAMVVFRDSYLLSKYCRLDCWIGLLTSLGNKCISIAKSPTQTSPTKILNHFS